MKIICFIPEIFTQKTTMIGYSNTVISNQYAKEAFWGVEGASQAVDSSKFEFWILRF